MSLIPHSILPRSMFDMDTWFNTTLDAFDPFDELDHIIGRNLNWLKRPKYLEEELVPKVPRKYRITVDCTGYKPSSIKTEFKDNRLIVSAKEEFKDEDGDYSTREFRKTYDLPNNAEKDKIASFVSGSGHLVVEIPLKAEETEVDDLFPRIVDKKDGGRQVNVDCVVPKGIDPSKLTVTCKDRDLIIKAEDVKEKPDTISRMYYYKRCRLPENTDFNSIKCHFENNKLAIQAPVNEKLDTGRVIPIEHKRRRKN